MSDGVRGNSSLGPAETEHPKKNDNDGARRDPLRDLPEWLVEFKENLVDESVPETTTHPVFLVNYFQNSGQKWFRASIVFALTSRRTEFATSA